MAATVTNMTLAHRDPEKYHAVLITNIYVDTAETAVVKIDKSALVGPDGTEPSKINIASIDWSIQGYTYIKVVWDHTSDVIPLLLTGNGSLDFEARGLNCLVDSGTGETGDLCITTVGTTATSTYTMLIVVKKDN